MPNEKKTVQDAVIEQAEATTRLAIAFEKLLKMFEEDRKMSKLGQR
jgi:hypothetical protein